jgi:3-oxoacyl-[acyl-carrier-protein] synthase-1
VKQQAAVGIQAMGCVSALGDQPHQMFDALTQPMHNTLTARHDLIVDKTVWVGQVHSPLLAVPSTLSIYASRNLQLALTALAQIQDVLEQTQQQFPASRLGVVIGSSTSGIADNEPLLSEWFKRGELPADFSYHRQEMGATAVALRDYLGWQGPAFGVSTACSSSAKALASAQRLINAGICDAVLVGGVDSLCRLTLNGFNSLESLSSERCRPFSQDRDGINIGEAAALFILSKQPAEVMLYGVGESSDAWHISAPHPEGTGAAVAMQRALDSAGMRPTDIAYVNLHGTATKQNDAMEAKAIIRLRLERPYGACGNGLNGIRLILLGSCFKSCINCLACST